MRRMIICVLFVLPALWVTGCDGNKRGEEVRQQEQRIWESENVVLEFYTWSDEENYVGQVVDAYNSLKGREAVRLHVIPNKLHGDWIKNYDGSIGADILGLRGNRNLLELQNKGILLDLRPYLQRGNLDVRGFGNMYNEIEYKGGYYGLPTRSSCWVLFYNKEIFDSQGIPYPGQMTWEEYIQLSRKLTSGSGDGQVWGGYYPPWIFHMSAIQKGIYLLDDDLEPIRESLELTKRLYTSGSHMPYEEIADRSDDCRYDFGQGKTAMLISGEWMVNMLMEDEKSGLPVPDWDIAPLPVPEGVEEGTTAGMYQFAGITSTCKYPEAAYEFLEFLCGEQGARIYARNAMIPGWTNEEIRQIYEEAVGDRNIDLFFETQIVSEQPMWNRYDQLLELFKEDAELYMKNKISLEEAMEDFEEKRKQIWRPES